jgi:NDP-sugar pyrophosphorylase family protein
MKDVIRIGNCSGFYGDRLDAAREMVEGGPIDVLTGDYLAELTMSILYNQKQSRAKTPATSVRFSNRSKILQSCALTKT